MIQSKFQKLFFLKYKALIFLLFLVLFSVDGFAKIQRPTTFDDRSVCELSKGVWREFGNGCIDSCNSKFDQFSVCTFAITFGCDCGKGRCWDGEACVSLVSYKKIFDENAQKEKLILEKAKNKRKMEAEKNSQEIVRNLISKKVESINNSEQQKSENNKDGKNNGQMSGNNYLQNYTDNGISIKDSEEENNSAALSQAVQSPQNNQISKDMPNEQPSQQLNPILNPANDNQNTAIQIPFTENNSNKSDVVIPPLFLEKEAKVREAQIKEAQARQLEEQKAQEELKKVMQQLNNPQEQKNEIAVEPKLPSIPLPQ